jgi:hypothetical protein
LTAASSARLLPWMLMWTAIGLSALAVGLMNGCGGRTVFVPEESPMRVGPRADLRVYHRVNGEWTLSENAIRIPEGWYLVPPSYVK